MTTIDFAIGPSSLGLVAAGWSREGLAAVFLGDDEEVLEADLRDRFPQKLLVADHGARTRDLAQVIEAVEGRSTGAGMILDLGGTEFQRRVWAALQRIPAGETASYGEVASAIGAPGSARAVAQACGANPVAVIVPCHRVVGSDGQLGGYHWGVERKRALLDRETNSPLAVSR
jgi:AraC family transcriptional regulator of adaptative response/methylated-DNA-[protein]-cysteine methyltransferase